MPRDTEGNNARRRAKYAADPTVVKNRNLAWSEANRIKKRAINKRWRDTNPGAKEKIKRSSLKFHYGISVEEYEAFRLKQGNKCASCNKEFDGTKHGGPFVDHDHATDKVRALLCHQCNTALGLMGEDPNKLILLSSYISQYLK